MAVHDPQPAGLIAGLRGRGASVIWRCHVALDRSNERAREPWQFLYPCIVAADACVFSRESFALEGLDPERAELLGQRARERGRDEFTSRRSVLDYLRLIRRVLDRSGVRAAA